MDQTPSRDESHGHRRVRISSVPGVGEALFAVSNCGLRGLYLRRAWAVPAEGQKSQDPMIDQGGLGEG